jgi:rhodanese-related sulfurtransferase
MARAWLVLLLAAGCAGSGGGPADGVVPPADVPMDMPGDAIVAEAAGDGVAATLGSLTVDELHAALPNKDFLLINVHVPDAGEIPGTDKHLTYADVPAIAAYIGTDLGRKVVVYCYSEGMSVPAGQGLVALGYRDVRYLVGGMTAWKAAGYPFTPPPSPSE